LKMKKKEFLKCLAFCFTLLFLILYATSAGFASEYQFDLTWGSEGSGDSEFVGPSGIAVHSSGDVYVTDMSNSRIQKFDSNGNFISTWGAEGSGEGEFSYPTGVAVDASGEYVYVVDSRNYRIVKLDSEGNFITSWGPFEQTGTGSLIMEPAGVTVDDAGEVYVTDIWQSLIWKFDSDGNYISHWLYPYGSGDSFRPTGIAVNATGIYMTDYLNSYVHKLASTGDLQSWGGFDGTEDGEFTYPSGIAVDSLGNVIVADTLNNRIQSFDSGGSFVAAWGSLGSGDGEFDRPFGVGADSFGNVFVVDTFNHRIQKFYMTTIIIDDCDSGIENQVLDDGYTMASKIAECAYGAETHGGFVSCVDKLTNNWKKAKLIKAKEKNKIKDCAAQSSIGK
jgi:DNA-binding beta-propeller fold protein YncE